jgi:hypothetical protein
MQMSPKKKIDIHRNRSKAGSTTSTKVEAFSGSQNVLLLSIFFSYTRYLIDVHVLIEGCQIN